MIDDALKRLDEAITKADWPVIRSAARELVGLAAGEVQRAAADRLRLAAGLGEACRARDALRPAFMRRG